MGLVAPLGLGLGAGLVAPSGLGLGVRGYQVTHAVDPHALYARTCMAKGG